jgi:multidrug efflux pump subunit AcrA (membrane-fusion protein)
MCRKRTAHFAVLPLALCGAVLAGGEPGQPAKKKAEPNPLHVKLSAQVPGVIVQFGDAKKPLRVGDRVEQGQVLVQLYDRLARLDLEAARARLAGAEAEHRGAKTLADEAYQRRVAAERLFTQNASAREDKDAAILTYNKYFSEMQTKEGSVKSAAIEVNRAALILDLHQLRSPATGVVRAIYRTRGEGAKALDAVLLIEETSGKE